MADLARQLLVAIAPIAFTRLCDAVERRAHRDLKPDNVPQSEPATFAAYAQRQRSAP